MNVPDGTQRAPSLPPPTPAAAWTSSTDEVPPAPVGGVGRPFTPLRAEPPPQLFATWWLRYLLVLAQLTGIAVLLLREYAVPGGMTGAPVVIPHAMAAIMLVGWSALAMVDAARLVPATRYRRPSRAWVAVLLWLGAFVAPVAAVTVTDLVRERFADSGDGFVAITLSAGAVLASFLLVWLPFRYHVRQAHRIGAPVTVVAAWFWLPLLAVVGVLAAMALGLQDNLAGDGYTDLERTIRVGALYGVPALMFALSTWRATTVFDEVIELRWMRWRNEWEQTLAALAAQPDPGPEASPVIERR